MAAPSLSVSGFTFMTTSTSEARRRKSYFDPALIPFLYSLDNSLKSTYRHLLPPDGADVIHVTLQALLLDARLLFAAFKESHRLMEESPGRYVLAYQLDAGAPDPR